jgi:RNA polymerase sigma factor (sigma-70 family)
MSDWIHAAVERYERPLVAYAHRFLGDVEAARDVVQDAFLRLCAQEREAVAGHLAEWLFTVCRNLALDRLRRRPREVAMDAQDSAIAELPAAAPPPSQPLEASEARAGLLALLATLPPRQQEIVRLRFQQGLSYKQIAAITSLSATNVGFLIHTAMRALHQRAPAELEHSHAH